MDEARSLRAAQPVKQPIKARWLLRDLTLTAIVCSTLGSFGAFHFLLDLMSHFRCQYLAALSVLAVLLWRMKSPCWAGVALLSVVHNAILVGPYYLPAGGWVGGSATTQSSQPMLKIISFNVHTANRNGSAVLSYLQGSDADLILLTEVDHRWIRELQPLLDAYPHHVLAPEADNFGIALLSKLPLTKRDVVNLGPDQPLTIHAELEFDGRQIAFLGTHPLPPMRSPMAKLRNEQLASVAERAKSTGLPTIVAGDLNATPWCAGFRPLFTAGLVDTALGFGVQRTWNAKVPLSWIPIDHVLATSEFVTLRRAVGPNCGSDHYAVEAELRLKN
jgi:endonuclease/exonuclease/phosphatase (EEP) superfamily protein YafD